MKAKMLITTMLRSFFIQASMNFERMHNIGFAFIMVPVLRLIYKDEEKLKLALKRHLEFYNCHPYMSSFILGVTLRLEEKYSKEEIDNPQLISQVKNSMMGPFAAMGDMLFWRTLRPLVAVISVTFAVKGYYYAPIIYLVVYNIPHLIIRFVGVYLGYNHDIRVIKKVQSFDFNRLTTILGIIALGFTGILFKSIVTWEMNNLSPLSQLAILVFSIIALRKGVKPLHILLLFMLVVYLANIYI